MSKFTLTFEPSTYAFEEPDFASEVANALRRVAQKVDRHSDTPLEQGVAEKGRVLDTMGSVIGEWEYEA